MTTKEQTKADYLVKFMGYLLGLLVYGGMLWLIWRPTAPEPEPPALAAYHARQKEACTVVKAAQASLVAKGLEQQAKKLDVDSVCDPGRPVRQGLYWLLGLSALPFFGLAFLFRVSPRF